MATAPLSETETDGSIFIEKDAVCRICHEGHSSSEPLYHPCLCKGSIRYIHEKCLNTWLKHNKSAKCEVCKHSFIYKPIFIEGETIPSKINCESVLNIMSWILDELITKNSNIIIRLCSLLFLWFILAPNIILQINNIFYKYFVVYDMIHFNYNYYKYFKYYQSLIKLNSIKVILSYLCPFQLFSHTFQPLSLYYSMINTFKGIIFIIFILIVCGIALCMKNNSKIVRPPTQINQNNIVENGNIENENVQNDEKEEKTEYELIKSPSLLLCEDTKIENEYEYEYEYESDGESSQSSQSSSSTLSELEFKLNKLEKRIQKKKEKIQMEMEMKEEEKKQDIEFIEQNEENNNDEIDELDLIFDTIGLNDNYYTLLIKHIYWILWIINNHMSHFIVPHFIGQITLHIIYLILFYMFEYNNQTSVSCRDLIDLNQYHKSNIFTNYGCNLCVIIVGYASCFVYQWILSKFILTLIQNLQQFLSTSIRQNTSICVFHFYVWLFNKMDIIKGIFFLYLKFMLFPFCCLLSIELCFSSIRQESQWHKYIMLHQTFMFNKQSNDANQSLHAAIMYTFLMVLWTSICISAYLSTVDILEKIMRPTAFTFLFRSAIETKNWLHPYSYQEQSWIQFKKWFRTTLHFVVVIFLFLGTPSWIISQCNHIVPLNVPSVGTIGLVHVKSLLLQDYVLLFSILPMLLFWQPIFRVLLCQTVNFSAYLLQLKFYLLRNHQLREENRMDILDENVWHNQQPFMDQMEPNNIIEPNNIEEEMKQFINDTVNKLIDNAIDYSLDSITNELSIDNDINIYENATIKSITNCIEFLSTSDINGNIIECKHDNDNDNLYEIEAIIDHVSNEIEAIGDVFNLYRIKWKDFSLADSTWEPIENIINAMDLIDKYNKANCDILLENYWKDQFLLNNIWYQLYEGGYNKNNNFGMIWCSNGKAFQILDVNIFVEYFLKNDEKSDNNLYEIFISRMILLGFELQEDTNMFFHPCFSSKSEQLIELIGKNTVLFENEIIEEKDEIIEIPQHNNDINENNNNMLNDNNNNENDMDMMGLFDGIDLGGSEGENIIPAPIVMNVQLDNFGRLIRINVELDSYSNNINNSSNNEKKQIEFEANDIDHRNGILFVDDANIVEYKEEEEEEEEKKQEEKEESEEKVHVRELMSSLNSYQKSELLRDILSICHLLYISEDKYTFIYNHNTKSDITHPLIRVLKTPSELISINDIVTSFDELLLYGRVILTFIITIIILNSFHLILFLQCLLYGRKLFTILGYIPNFFIFELGYTNFTRFDSYGIMSFAFNQHTIHDLHCIALSLWWFPAIYYILNIMYTLIINLFNKCSQIIDKFFDFMFSGSLINYELKFDYIHLNHLIKNIFIHKIGSMLNTVEYITILIIHHIIFPLLFGFTFQFTLLFGFTFVQHNESFCLSFLEAWIEGFFVWNIFLPIIPLSIIADKNNQFREKFKVYLNTTFSDMNLFDTCQHIYWPFLKIIIVQLFIPIAFVQSEIFKYIWNAYNNKLLKPIKHLNTSSDLYNELIFEFNKKFYLRYIMRKLLQLRLFIAYKRAIKNGFDYIWEQFIFDKYVCGQKLVNYYYNQN